MKGILAVPFQIQAMKLPLLLSSLWLATSALHAQTNGMAEYQKSKYGFFVHFVWGGGPGTQFTKPGPPLRVNEFRVFGKFE